MKRKMKYVQMLSVLVEAYADARKQAAAETGLSRGTFPAECDWNLDTLLAEEE